MTMKNDIYEFPDDDKVVPFKLDDIEDFINGNGTTTRSTFDEEAPNLTFRSSLLVVVTIIGAVNFGSFLTRFAPFFGSLFTFGVVLILSEWHGVYGSLLTPKKKAFINYGTVLKSYKEFIPNYHMDWLFGGRYVPYSYGCNGPSLNPDMDRTPDDPQSRSPTKPRGDEKLKKDF